MIYFLIIILVFLITFAIGSYSGAPWVPSRKGDVDRFLKLADIKPGQKVYDLGCGDGRIVLAAARAGADATGFEISLLPYLLAQFRRLFLKNKKSCKIYFKSFWSVDLSDVDVVYLFLMPKKNIRMKKKLEKELKSGAKVIAYVWPIVGWKPVVTDKKDGETAIYLYET